MLKLMKLEWKKNNIEKYTRNALIVPAVLALFLFAQCYLGIARDPEMGVPDSAPGTLNISSQVELLTNLCFLVYATVMFSTYIISAYKEKTMDLMFLYPVKRRRILISKILAAWTFSFGALVFTKIFLYFMLYAVSKFRVSDFPVDYNILSIGFYLQLVMKSFVTVSLALIPLYIGFLKKSSKTAIICSFILFFVMNGTIGDFSLAGNSTFPVIATIVSFICGILTVINSEKKDI